MTLKFVVMSDLHVMPQGKLSMTLDTGARLEQAVDAVIARYSGVDFCVLAGDLADLGEPAAYERLQAIIARLPIPVHITLGNHDDRPSFLEVFGTGSIAETGKVDKVIDSKGHRIILLDSSEPGRVDGVLTPTQVDWLKARLAEAMDRPVIVILHHNANALHIESDDIRIIDADPFVATLKTHPYIRQVIAGHVHLTSTATWRGLPFTTLAGGHYSCTVDQPHIPMRRLTGPGQMAFVISDDDGTTVLFDDFIDGNAEIF
ncbi:metallophosphoesterase [Devosia sp. SL43]|uniref:metallophosphoesterase n=1 Tax=Devosia sp. SL43 TaxID=2806348 RepID=UPI001F177CA3|nr:metallophosphoesterase [Devosia sp. SL43]UJW87551.1 metallophosphoesterase [Devosia sp. SL43]